MLIAIISDLHDNLINLKTFLAWAKNNKIEKIINLGDVANSDSLKYLAKNFIGQIFLVKGNAELYPEAEIKNYPNLKYFGQLGETEIDGLKIGFVHQPILIKKLKDAYSKNKFDFIFYGHTHKPWFSKDKKNKELIISNPGTLGGIFQSATFSILETTNKKLELKILADI